MIKAIVVALREGRRKDACVLLRCGDVITLLSVKIVFDNFVEIRVTRTMLLEPIYDARLWRIDMGLAILAFEKRYRNFNLLGRAWRFGC